jgi:hypothetical protein
MQYIKRIITIFCAVLINLAVCTPALQAYYEYSDYTSGYSSNVPYKFTYPDAPYKYTHPDTPYKYTHPDSPYKYTHPDTPYRYTQPDTPYRFSYPNAPYKFTYPDAPYRYTHPEAPYKYTHPDTPYKYTNPRTEPLYPGSNVPGDDMYRYSDVGGDSISPAEEEVDLYSAPYWDISGHPAELEIIRLHELGIVEGYEDGSFRPDAPVARAEMVKMVMETARIEALPEEHDKYLYFTDLEDWQAQYVNAAYSMQIVEGYYDKGKNVRVFMPNENVTRAEGLKVVLASAGIQPGEIKESSYVDVNGWAVPWAEVGASIGIANMPEDKRFYPNRDLTRGEAAIMIVRMIDFQSGQAS